MNKFVASTYRILKAIMLVAGVGFGCSLIIYKIASVDVFLHSYAEFFTGYWYIVLMAAMPVAWAVGRLKITLDFQETFKKEGEEK